MKKNQFLNLITLLFLFILTSCGSSSTSNSDFKKIIGNPFKITKLEVAQYDFPNQMNWEEAKKACEALGDGWRLPTKEELYVIFLHKGENGEIGSEISGLKDLESPPAVGGLKLNAYWTSTELVVGDGFNNNGNKNGSGYVRAVRL